MTAADPRLWSRTIHFHVYVLIALITALGLAMTGYLSWRKAASEEASRLTNDYHLTSAFRGVEAWQEIHHMLAYVRFNRAGIGKETQKFMSREMREFNVNISFYIIEEKVEEVLELERTFADPRFRSLAGRLERQYAPFRDGLAKLRTDERVFFGASVHNLPALLVTLEQLVRLHSITYRDLLSEKKAEEKRNVLFLSVFAAAVVLVGLLSMWGSLGAIRTAIGRQRKIEESLQQSEEQVRSLLVSTAEAIFGLDLEGNCTFCNPSCIKMLGYQREEELLGKNMHDLIHHTHLDGTPYPVEKWLIYKTLQEGERAHVDTEVIWRKNGTSFPVEYWSYPVHRDGKLVGAVVTFIDITERKRAEEALRESEEHYRTLFETNPHGIQEIDTFGNILFCNHALCQMLGYSAKELKRMNITDLLPTKRQDRIIKDIEKYAKEQPKPFPYLNNYLTKDGRVIDVGVNWDYKRNNLGDVVGLISIVTDITEQKQVKKQLVESELGKHAALGALDQIPFGIIVVDSDATIKFINQTAKELAAEKDGVLIRQDRIFTGRPKQRKRLMEIIRNTIENAKSHYLLPNEVIALMRPSGGEPLSVMVCSLWGNHMRFGLEKPDEPLAVLFVTAPERQLKAPAETLQNLFGLTATEANITEKLVAGMTLEEAAKDLNIAKNTARHHLRGIFGKTGANRQATLIKQVLSTPVWFAATNQTSEMP